MSGLPRGRKTRRAFLRTGSLSAAGLLVACAEGDGRRGVDEERPFVSGAPVTPKDPSPPPEKPLSHGTQVEEAAVNALPSIDDVHSLPESNAFPLGVATGDVTSSGGIFWTLSRSAHAVALYIFDESSTVYSQRVTPANGGFIHVDVATLSSGARYTFAFVELSQDDVVVGRSAIGRVRVALAAGALEIVRLGAVSCTSNTFPRHETLEHAGARLDLDAFLLLGDTCYTDEITDIAQSPAETLDEYRARWEHNLGKAGYRALRMSTSVIATWDDHEIHDDWNPEDVLPDRFAAGAQAFFENLPIRRNETSPTQLWRSFRWGNTVEVFVLDSRGERRPSTRGSADEEYISAAQLEWLRAGLSASPCVFKVIMNSVPITALPLPETEDRWTTYGNQRGRILRHIDDNDVTGVLWLAGDVHFGCAGRVSSSGAGRHQIEIIAGPGRQIPLTLGFDYISQLSLLPQFDFATDANNYVELELDPVARRATVIFIGLDGAVIHEAHYDVDS